MSFTVIVNI